MNAGPDRRRLKVGIIAPCPPPYGGITRIIENHLALWPQDEVEAHFVPMHLPPDARPFEEAVFHDLRHGPMSWKSPRAYAPVMARAPLSWPRGYFSFLKYNMALSALIREEGLDVLYAH